MFIIIYIIYYIYIERKKQRKWLSLSIKTWFLCSWKLSAIILLQLKKDAVEIGKVIKRLTNDQRDESNSIRKETWKKRWTKYLKEMNILSNLQSGFRTSYQSILTITIGCQCSVSLKGEETRAQEKWIGWERQQGQWWGMALNWILVFKPKILQLYY